MPVSSGSAGVAILRDRQVGRQGGSAEGAQVDVDDPVFDRAEVPRHGPGAAELMRVPLAVAEAERAAGESLGPGDGEGGRGIEPSAEEDDRGCG